MSAYQLFSDATLDLPHTTIEELDIQVIPMHFDLAENSYRHFEDERELSLEEFYRQLRAGAPAVTSRSPRWFTRICSSRCCRRVRISCISRFPPA